MACDMKKNNKSQSLYEKNDNYLNGWQMIGIICVSGVNLLKHYYFFSLVSSIQIKK